MGLNRCPEANNAGRALDHVVDEGKSEKCGEEGARGDGKRMVDNEKERSEEGEKSPKSSEDEPARALSRGNHLNVAEIKSLVPFDQDQLFN
jgi:hypothetical protein